MDERGAKLYISAGQFKGYKLGMPNNREIRPTPGKVKEALFSIIGHDLEGDVVLDLFAGTGNLALEAISRGAGKAYLVEKSAEGCQLINKNIAYLGVGDKCRLIRGDWKQSIFKIKETIDLIFLDPPYQAGLMEDCLNTIGQNNLLADGGIIVAEHDAHQILPSLEGGFSIWKSKKYGNTAITLYTKIERTSL